MELQIITNERAIKDILVDNTDGTEEYKIYTNYGNIFDEYSNCLKDLTYNDYAGCLEEENLINKLLFEDYFEFINDENDKEIHKYNNLWSCSKYKLCIVKKSFFEIEKGTIIFVSYNFERYEIDPYYDNTYFINIYYLKEDNTNIEISKQKWKTDFENGTNFIYNNDNYNYNYKRINLYGTNELRVKRKITLTEKNYVKHREEV